MNDRLLHLSSMSEDDNALQTLMDADAQIDGAMLLALYQAAHEGDGLPKELDRHCQNTIRRHFQKVKRKNFLTEAIRKAACIAAAILASGILTLCISPEARAAVSKWISGWEGGLYVYAPTDTDTITPDYRFLLTKIPEGYSFDQETVMPTGGLFRYLDNENNRALFLVYIRQEEGSEMDLILTEELHKVVTVNGTFADLYYYPDLHDDSSLVWIDPETNYLLHISGWFPEEEMIELAESVIHTEREPFSLE